MQSSKSIAADRNARRPGCKVRDCDSISLMTKTGVDLQAVGRLLDCTPITVIITETYLGGPSRDNPEVELPEGARINCITPTGVLCRHNIFDVNVRTARKHNANSTSPHKSLAISRGVGQAFMIVRNPEVSSLDAAKDLQENGIQILTGRVSGNRQARVIIKATTAWVVVRAELYDQRSMSKSPLDTYRELTVKKVPNHDITLNPDSYEDLLQTERDIESALTDLQQFSEVESHVDDIQRLRKNLQDKLLEVSARIDHHNTI